MDRTDLITLVVCLPVGMMSVQFIVSSVMLQVVFFKCSFELKLPPPNILWSLVALLLRSSIL